MVPFPASNHTEPSRNSFSFMVFQLTSTLLIFIYSSIQDDHLVSILSPGF